MGLGPSIPRMANGYWEFGNLASVINLLSFTSTLKKQPPEKGFLFGYPNASKQHNGIIVIAETLAGG